MIKAKIHSDIPERSSERPFAEKLLTLEFPDNNRPHLWFTQLPGLKDIDVVIWLPRTGLFIVEMKSWPISVIQHISTQGFEIDSRVKHSTKKSPWEQVQEAEQQFRGRLSDDPDTKRKLGKPWISPVVALYRISRDDFESKIEGETGAQSEIEFKRDLAQGTIFREDLDSGEAFIKRLGYCRYHPIYGTAPNPNYGPNAVNSIEEAVKALDTFITPHLRAGRRTPAYDKARIQELEKDSAKRLKTLSWGNPVFCTGYAGTGKTLLGLQAALLRLEAAPDRPPAVGAGLFVCFNKVLAADIKRLTALSPRFLDIKFDVYDIFELLRVIAGRLKIDVSSNTNDADGWAVQILAEIMKRKDANANAKKLFESWGLIVVDEAQDLADWAWDFLDALSEHSNNLFVIDGKNQLLYRDERAEHLKTVYDMTHESQDKANLIEQRRVFRTTDTTFLISQLFMLTYPDLKAAERKWEEHLKPAHEKAKKMADKRDARQSPLFDFDVELSRRGGYAHKLVPFPPVSKSEMIRHVTEYVQKGYEKVKEYYREDEPSNVLILVPFKNKAPRNDYHLLYDWSEIARTACRNLQLRYIDYSDESQRRRAYAGDEVRICTFHSSRGIEGLHSIVLGFDSLAEAADDADWRVGHLAYITLSRSVYDTDILYIESNKLSERGEIRFLKGIIEIVGK